MAVTSSRHHRRVTRILLLLPSATYRAGDFLAAAHRLGVDLVVGSDEPNSLEGLMGARSLHLDFRDAAAAAEAIVAHDARVPLDAVVAVDDQGAVAAAVASQRLGLRHNPPEAVLATRDKLRMRTVLAAGEVFQPTFVPVPSKAGAGDVVALVSSIGFPCVIKPTTLSGSQGVIRVDGPEELWPVVERVRRIAAGAGVDPHRSLLAEGFLPGAEVAVEGMLRDGSLRVLAIFDKPDPLDGPYFEETIYVTPSRMATGDVAAVTAATRSAATAVGLREGPIHAELRVKDGRASIVELAARTIGGLCSRTLAFGTGHSLEELVMAHALDRSTGAPRAPGAAGVMMLPIPRAGVLLGVDGREDALAVPGIVGLDITVAPGRRVLPVPEGNRYLGFLFARGADPLAVEAALRTAFSSLEIRIHAEDAPAATTEGSSEGVGPSGG
jgi:biotin carboxylase